MHVHDVGGRGAKSAASFLLHEGALSIAKRRYEENSTAPLTLQILYVKYRMCLGAQCFAIRIHFRNTKLECIRYLYFQNL